MMLMTVVNLQVGQSNKGWEDVDDYGDDDGGGDDDIGEPAQARASSS